jgi:cytochrome c5
VNGGPAMDCHSTAVPGLPSRGRAGRKTDLAEAMSPCYRHYPRSMTRTLAVSLLVSLTSVACGNVQHDSDQAVALASVVPAAGTPADATEPAPETPAPETLYPAYAEGFRVYREQFCGTCHAFAVAGTAGVFGPTHDDLRRTAEAHIRDPKYTGSATTAEEYVRESITDPGVYRVPGYEVTRFLMPTYVNLSDAEVDAVVHMLLDLGTGDD